LSSGGDDEEDDVVVVVVVVVVENDNFCRCGNGSVAVAVNIRH
jgi:hypothetical protein